VRSTDGRLAGRRAVRGRVVVSSRRGAHREPADFLISSEVTIGARRTATLESGLARNRSLIDCVPEAMVIGSPETDSEPRPGPGIASSSRDVTYGC
jgi:hypothetical protein